MDQFEAARLKTEKREARKLLSMPQFVETHKEEDTSVHARVSDVAKQRKNAIFTVSVDMPHAQFTFNLVKESILSHAPKNRLTESEIRKHIIQGLKPLLGGID